MIKEANLGKEIVVRVENKAGILANMSKILAERGINVEGVAGYVTDKEAKLMLITSDNQRSLDALKKGGYKSIKENEVVIAELENKPGALKTITAKLVQENIDIKYVYGTTCLEGCAARIVLSTNNNEKAVVALKK